MRVPALIACVVVAAVSDSRGALTASTYIGLAVGVAFLIWLARARKSDPVPPRLPTRLDLAKARYTYGDVPVEEFERDVRYLFERGEADEPLHIETQERVI
jgi:hypothetical protein